MLTEKIHYHYTSPRKMLAVHHRALHEKLDRMLAAGQHKRINTWQRHFAHTHLRIAESKATLARVLGGSQSLRGTANATTAPLHGSMRDHIELHMEMLWNLQSVIYEFAVLGLHQPFKPAHSMWNDIPKPEWSRRGKTPSGYRHPRYHDR